MSSRGRSRGYSPGRRGTRTDRGGRSGRGGSGGSGGRSSGRSSGGRGSFSSGGRGGGGSVGRPPSNPKSALSNLILADLAPSFRFYLYSTDFKDVNGNLIESRRRRQDIFNLGLKELLRNKGYSEADEINFRRGVFFEGSYFFSSRIVPGLEAENLPKILVGAKEKNTNMPMSDNGDCLEIMGIHPYSAPELLMKKKESSQRNVSPSEAKLEVDRLCSSCTTSFTSIEALFAHCRIQNHTPQLIAGNEELKPANKEVFLAYCNICLQHALAERMARWGREYVDPANQYEPTDRNNQSLGVKVFQAYSCEFGLLKSLRPNAPCALNLVLTVDLRAKILRTKDLLETIYEGRDPNTTKLSNKQITQALKTWRNEVVIATYDKRCYSVIDLLFDESPASKMISDLNISHAEYFTKRKKLTLKYPNAKPLVAVLGRQNSTIYLPAELVCGNELEPKLKQQLPSIASFKPEKRLKALEEIKRFLKPGAQKTKGTGGGLLPALGILLKEDKICVPIDVISLPMIIAAGVQVPARSGGMWAPILSQANFKVHPTKAVQLNVILIYHESLSNVYGTVFNKLRDHVNRFNATYRFPDRPYQLVKAGDLDRHWGEVEKFFGGNRKMPNNVFVIDFSQPPRRASSDPAYSVVKQMLTKAGYLSQFINWNTYDHGHPREEKRSNIILQGCARQILSKCGFRIWWVKLPPTLPLPAVFVGVDVFHAPRRYDPKLNKRTAKESVAAIVVQVIRSAECTNKVEIYTETAKRETGQEIYLGDVLNQVISRAMKTLKVNPMSCIVWRDGVGDPTIHQVKEQEIPQIEKALQPKIVGKTPQKKKIPLSYIVCQKKIAIKFITQDGKFGMPAGSLVTSLQGPHYQTFYINGTAPPYSTPKPVRFVIVQKETNESLSEITWALCHDYPNWTGPIKLPAPVQLAHKLAELAGTFVDGGDHINHKAFANRIHFL